MRLTMTVTLATLMVAIAIPAFAELQNVEVGGSIRIRGNYFSPEFTPPVFEEDGNSLSFIEQRTTISVKADFTKDVSAYIELDSYDIYGEDFRSSAITGLDTRQAATGAGSADDVEVYQAYIETRETWGVPLHLKIGRQEIQFGSEWLMGNNDTASFFTGLSFDGITAAWEADSFTVTGVWAKLAEVGAIEEDGDTDLYILYGSYTGVEHITIDAYWMYVRSGFNFGEATAAGVVGEFIEDILGVDDFDDVTNLHTIGLRGAGSVGGFDYEGEIAYQFGEATAVTQLFFNPDPASLLGFIFGDDSEDFDAFALNLEVGYTFDASLQPRIYLGVAWFEGEDEREDTFTDFIRSLLPFGGLFAETDSSIGFNRLFSDWEYGEFLDSTDLSNTLIFRGGISIQPTESLEISLHGLYFQADEETTVNGILGIPFFSHDSDDEVGFELDLYLTYQYSEDLTFELGYAHFFADDGAEDGNFLNGNGLLLTGGSGSDDDLDYVYFETKISF